MRSSGSTATTSRARSSQQPCQGAGTRSQVHDPLHAVRQQPIHCGDGRSGSKAIVVRSDLPEAARSRRLLISRKVGKGDARLARTGLSHGKP